jgi:hypothetical protein
MTMASTRSITKAYARIDLLKLQFSVALKRTTDLSDAAVERLLKGIENQWINRIEIYGVDSADKAWCQLRIIIDWRRHQIHIAAGRTVVSPYKGWPDDLAFELSDTIEVFMEYVRQYGLETTWITGHPRLGERRAAIFAELGLVDRDAPAWARRRVANTAFSVPELDELTVDVCLLE